MSRNGFEEDHEPLRKVRKRVMHRMLPGPFPTRKAVGGHIRASQPLMMDGLIHHDTDPACVRISAFPVEARYLSAVPDGGAVVRSHVPDVGLLRDDGAICYVDYIPLNIQTEMPWLEQRTRELRLAFREQFGAAYAVHDERCIYIRPRFQNLQTMWKHQLQGVDDEALMAVRKALVSLPAPTTIAEIRTAAALPRLQMVWSHPEREHRVDLDDVDRAFSSVMQLAMNGEVWIDLSRPFDGATAVDRNRR
jgi:hypothetical protein